MFMSSPQASRNMAELYKEIGKLDGIPVLQTITMGAAGQPDSGSAAAGGGAPAQSAGQQQQQQQQQPQQQADKPSIGGALGGALGGRFGLGRKKQQQSDQSSTQQQPQQPQAQPQGGGSPGSLMEATTEMTGFSSAAVDDSMFAVPAGFKKVESRR